MLRFALLFLLPLLICSLSSSLSSSANLETQLMPYEDAEAYQVYAAVLPSEWAVREAKAKRLIIKTETDGYEMCLEPENGYKDIMKDAIANFVELNKISWSLQRMLNLDMPYKLITDEEFKSVFKQDNWDWREFYKKYPDSGGVIKLSAVGFNADKTIAIVFVSHNCGSLCGGGDFHVLQKQEGKWVPLKWQGSSCFFNI